jgi:hypothetical protein
MKGYRLVFSCLGAGALALSLGACGGGSGGTPPTTPSTPAAPPGASVTAAGNGAIVIHPSAAPSWFYALEMPVHVQETAGGTADWNYARLALYKGGVETERAEIGSDVIIAGGGGRVDPRSDNAYTLLFRVNSADDFDDIELVFGFSDVNRGTPFTASVPFDTFTDVAVSLIPLSVPQEGKVDLAGR